MHNQGLEQISPAWVIPPRTPPLPSPMTRSWRKKEKRRCSGGNERQQLKVGTPAVPLSTLMKTPETYHTGKNGEKATIRPGPTRQNKHTVSNEISDTENQKHALFLLCFSQMQIQPTQTCDDLIYCQGTVTHTQLHPGTSTQQPWHQQEQKEGRCPMTRASDPGTAQLMGHAQPLWDPR